MTEAFRTAVDDTPMTLEESIHYGCVGVGIYIALMTFFLLLHLEMPFAAAFYYYVEVCLSSAGAIAVCRKLTMKLVTKYPRLRETNNPVPDEMPIAGMMFFIGAVVAIIAVGMNYGSAAAGMTMLSSFLLGVLAMHGIPWAKHQLRLSGWL